MNLFRKPKAPATEQQVVDEINAVLIKHQPRITVAVVCLEYVEPDTGRTVGKTLINGSELATPGTERADAMRIGGLLKASPWLYGIIRTAFQVH